MTAGVTAASGVAFYGISQATGSLGQWETLIGGVALILTAILNPEGIAGGIRAKAAEARAAKAAKAQGEIASASSVAAAAQ